MNVVIAALSMSAFVLMAGVGISHAAAKTEHAQTVMRAGAQASVKGSDKFFTGNVRIEPLFPATEEMRVSGGAVTFEPGARSFWHTHPTGQRLLVLSGVGRTGVWEGDVDEIRAGDVVVCPAGVKHWHGASPTSGMTHLALTGALPDGKNVDWLEEVTDEQYNK